MTARIHLSFAHRSDIDCLRAVAVLAVVLFHAGFLPGGFVGVDVFFVISGFLMASIITPAIAAGRFSLGDFYSRRLRRILPAYAVMIMLVSIGGCFVLLPFDIRDLGRSAVAAAGFHSNIRFEANATDYFAASSVAYQPLLHTWSLCVEAQFYLLFPLLVMALQRFGRKRERNYVLTGLGGLALASLLWSIKSVSVSEESAFFLFPSRMWELLLGALAFYAAARWRNSRLLAGAGWLLIFGSIAFFTEALPFPGATALVPTLGTAFILFTYSNELPGRISGLLYNSRLTRWLANLSYSLYLWHWPLFAFARYRLGEDLPYETSLLLLVASFVMAALSYLTVERVFLSHRPKTSLRAAAVPVTLLIVALISGMVVRTIMPKYVTGLLPQKVLEHAASERDFIKGDCLPVTGKDINTDLPCSFGTSKAPKTIFLWGNSYARMWASSLSDIAKRHGVAGVSAIKSACPPLLGDDSAPAGCPEFNQQALSYLKSHPDIKTIILASNWYDYNLFQADLDRTLSVLKAINLNIVVVMPPPYPGYAVPRALALAELRGTPSPDPILKAEHEKYYRKVSDAIYALQPLYNFSIVDPAASICNAETCEIQHQGRAIYYDQFHLNLYGADIHKNVFEPVFDETGQSNLKN